MTILKEVRNGEKGLEGICEDGKIVLLEPLKTVNVKAIVSTTIDYKEFCDHARKDFQYYQIGRLTSGENNPMLAIPFVTYHQKKS